MLHLVHKTLMTDSVFYFQEFSKQFSNNNSGLKSKAAFSFEAYSSSPV